MCAVIDEKIYIYKLCFPSQCPHSPAKVSRHLKHKNIKQKEMNWARLVCQEAVKQTHGFQHGQSLQSLMPSQQGSEKHHSKPLELHPNIADLSGRQYQASLLQCVECLLPAEVFGLCINEVIGEIFKWSDKYICLSSILVYSEIDIIMY